MRVFLLAVVAVFALTSCSAISKIEGLADKAAVSVEKANEILNEGVIVTSKLRQQVYAADKNGDGQVKGFNELWALLTGVLAVFGIGGGALGAKANSRVKTVEQQQKVGG